MKKIIFPAIAAMLMITSSCNNDDIDTNVVNEVAVNISLANFFSSYNFTDTRNNISVANDYRTFYSENKNYIHVRSLFYDSNGYLTDSIVGFQTNTNALQKSIVLKEGKYTVVTTLNFALDNNVSNSLWIMLDREKLSTAQLRSRLRQSKWSIMSYDAQTVEVKKGQVQNLYVDPQPVGALAYVYFQNFQFFDEETYGEVADNGVRSLAVFSQTIAMSYKLDPKATDRYVYLDASHEHGWYYLSDDYKPENFPAFEEAGHFLTNIYGYFYILAPSFNLCFGYTLEGENSFSPYGQANYTIENGKEYLAYWDWFAIGAPYFGIANNNHWNSYSTRSDQKTQDGNSYFDTSLSSQDNFFMYSNKENLKNQEEPVAVFK